MQFDAAKAVYRRAIDATASDGEGKVWWAGETDEIAQVVEAECDQAGAVIIAWGITTGLRSVTPRWQQPAASERPRMN